MRKDPRLYVKRAQVIAYTELATRWPDMYVCYSALRFYLRRDSSVAGTIRDEALADLPAAGKPINIEFYSRVLALYEMLASEGTKAPVRQIAEMLDANENTVKSWLLRARKYTRP